MKQVMSLLMVIMGAFIISVTDCRSNAVMSAASEYVHSKGAKMWTKIVWDKSAVAEAMTTISHDGVKECVQAWWLDTEKQQHGLSVFDIVDGINGCLFDEDDTFKDLVAALNSDKTLEEIKQERTTPRNNLFEKNIDMIFLDKLVEVQRNVQK